MSDRNPMVQVYPLDDGRWAAMCLESSCDWRQPGGEKTYTRQRASAHRAEHRQKAATGG